VASPVAFRRRAAGRPKGGGALGLLLPVIALLLWQALSSRGLMPDFLVAPSAVLRRFGEMASSGELWRHARASLFLVAAGFLIGTSGGVAIGLLSAVVRPVERFYEPLVSLTYPMPKVAFLPLIFAWFGLGSASKIFIICTSVFYPMYIAAYYGAKATKPVHIWSAQNMGASRLQIIWRIVAPTALPQIFSGLRIGLALSFIVMITSELVVSNEGLGFLIARAEDSLQFDLMFVAIASVGVCGFIADRALVLVRDRVLAGQLSGKGGAHA